MVLDEPTEHLDTDTSSALMDDIVNSFGDQGLVLITHRMSDAMRCDRVVVLHEGSVATEGVLAAVLVSSEYFAEGLRSSTRMTNGMPSRRPCRWGRFWN